MERPIHLRQYSICKVEPNTDDYVVVPVWIRQSSLDGLQEVIAYLDGLVKSSNDYFNNFELVMFYRTLRDCIDKAEKAAEIERNEK